jgi:hypothetical protein
MQCTNRVQHLHALILTGKCLWNDSHLRRFLKLFQDRNPVRAFAVDSVFDLHDLASGYRVLTYDLASACIGVVIGTNLVYPLEQPCRDILQMH